MKLSPEMTLKEAKEWLLERIDDGAACPCCTQFAKVYRRKINSTMARGLIAAFRAYGTEFGHLQQIRHRGLDNREESKLRYWGLMEDDGETREDGGHAGRWRVTTNGRIWVLNESKVPKYARIYDGRCIGLVGEPQSIVEALADKFDYRELMGWA
jgi:hypothetical protein